MNLPFAPSLIQPFIQQFFHRSVDHALKRIGIGRRVGQAGLRNPGQPFASLNHLENMLLADVRDLMPQRRGQFGFVLHLAQKTSRHEDVAGRGGEGIDRVVVEDGKTVGNVRPVRGEGHRPPNQIHIPNQIRLIDHATVSRHDLQRA